MTGSQTGTAHDHVPILDGLRAVALLLVLMVHFWWVPPQSMAERAFEAVRSVGWIGVDLFFVLSGFLITTILLRMRGRRRALTTFVTRRTLRIFPLYFLYLGVLLLVPAIVRRSTPQHETFVADQWWYWTYLQNIELALRPAGSLPPYVGHLWSLAVEEQFYLLWPLFVLFARPQLLVKSCVVLFVGTWALRLVIWDSWPDATWILTPTRAGGLMVGAFIAGVAAERPLEVWTPHAKIVGLAAVASALVVAVWRGGLHASDFWISMIGLTAVQVAFGAWLLLLVAGGGAVRNRRLLEASPLRAIGKYSYAMYVFHLPVVLALHFVVDRVLPGLRPVLGYFPGLIVLWSIAGTLTFLAAWLSWHGFERWFVELKDRVAPRPSLIDDAVPAASARRKLEGAQ